MKQGWEYKKLGDLCDIYQPKTLATEQLVADGKYYVYGANGIIGRYNDYNHEQSEILLTCRGATCGTINISQPYSWINGNAMVIHRKSEDLSFDFLKYLMLSLDYSLIITGAAQPQITRQKIAPIIVKFPSLSVQQSIVSELDKISELIRLKKEQLKDYDNLAQSIFYEMFGDPVVNEKGWGIKKLGNFCEIGTGSTPSRKNKEYYEGSISWVKSTEVSNCVIDSTEEHISEIAIAETNCTIYPKGTILIAMYGQGKTRGQIAILNIEATTNQAVAAILPSELCDKLFLYHCLHLMYENIRSMARGGNQANLNLAIVRSINIILPPLPLQQAFAQRIELIEQQKAEIQSTIADLETLLASRMQYWFDL